MNGLRVFGYDWLGRLHAVDRDGAWSDRGQIVRFSPASGEIEEAADARSLDEYLFEELPRNSRDWLSADYFEDWQAEVRRPLATTECASYRTPLLLGGEDDVPNLELELLNVHLATCGQIYQQIVGLPEGAHVEAVRFKR
jgi:hypothetical protein